MTTLQSTTPLQLHHLHLHSESPGQLAEFYRNLFELDAVAAPDGIYGLTGGERAIVIHPGASGELAMAAYAARTREELSVLRERLSDVARDGGIGSEVFFEPGAFSVTDPQGRRLLFGVPRTRRRPDRMAARLQHTVFQTTDLATIVDFYVNRVGFAISDEVVADDGSITTCFLRSDDEHHTLAFFQGSNNVWDHHCYETGSWNDIRDWGDRFAKVRRGIFFGPGRHGPGNNLFFMITDPDGNRVELSAELEHVRAGQSPGVWPHEEHTLNSWGRGWIRT
ncbi:glyoxalase [Cupriavidus pauculus]|uniref:Glyoxalase n=1 Tax=Cupriavidus pauculus TaxID=82633 RepID=A0A5P2H155_9BURK|nr:VOC family protein [Cupriavidus pauculus]QET01687.1 glyoxalase [Cupriavidus pauculus]